MGYPVLRRDYTSLRRSARSDDRKANATAALTVVPGAGAIRPNPPAAVRRSYVSRVWFRRRWQTSDGPLGSRAGSYEAMRCRVVGAAGRRIVMRTTGGRRADIGPGPPLQIGQRGSCRQTSRAT